MPLFPGMKRLLMGLIFSCFLGTPFQFAEAQTPTYPLKARFFPRLGWPGRLVGGTFQGSNNGNNWTTLATITTPPSNTDYTELALGTSLYRYLRYVAPANSYGNIAELEFYSGTKLLAGTGFGSPGSYQNSGSTFDKALDDDTSTYFDADSAGAGFFVGIDTRPNDVRARFFPFTSYGSLMVGGRFQGSDDGLSWVDLATITSSPFSNKYTELSLGANLYRYLRYVLPAGGTFDSSIAELEFYRGAIRLTGQSIGAGGYGGYTFDKALDGDTTTYFQGSGGSYVGLNTGASVALMGAWSVGPPITTQGPQGPQGRQGIRYPNATIGLNFSSGSAVRLNAYAAQDIDLWTRPVAGVNTTTPVSDVCSYTWSATSGGATAGTFLDGPSGTTALWQAPVVSTSTPVTITLTVRDQAGLNQGVGEIGARSIPIQGVPDQPLQFTVQLTISP